jgi:hypothetical protein
VGDLGAEESEDSMNKDHQIYELTETQRRILAGEEEPIPEGGDGYDEEQVTVMREDVARLEGYLKGRADSDKAGPSRPNADLTRRRR